jgi:hypothetical protein
LISLQFSVIRNNVLHDNGVSSGAGGIHLVDQPDCSKPSNNNVVVNNTVNEPRIAAIRINLGSVGNIIFNNALVASTVDRCVIDEVGGNSIDTASNVRRASTSGLFVDPAAGNYHPAGGSPVVNAGRSNYQGAQAPTTDYDANARPAGTTWDAGAFESGATPPPTGIGDTPALGVSLGQNTPNPFATSTRIAFDVAPGEAANVTIEVFDVQGRLVRSLARDRRASGNDAVVWDGRDDGGRVVPSGVYFYRLSTPAGTLTRRMTLVR